MTLAVAKAELYARDLAGVAWYVAPGSDPVDRVEVAILDDGAVAMRRPEDPAGTILRYTPEEWDAFTRGVRDGEFDGDVAG